MKEKTKERLEDLFFVSLAGLFFVSGAFLWLGFNNKLMELHAENTALKHHVSLLCNEVCLELENKERR